MGGMPSCWPTKEGYTHKECCFDSVVSGIWTADSEPWKLHDLLSIAYAMERPAGTHSHAALFGRLVWHLSRISENSLYQQARPVSIVEVGVWRGEFAERILQTFDEIGVTVEKYVLVDLWGEPSALQNSRSGGMGLDHMEEFDGMSMADAFVDAIRRLEPWSSKVQVLQEDSPTAASWLKKSGFVADFIFIDGRHDHDSVWEDLRSWWPIVKVGGFFAGHDYVDTLTVSESPDLGVKRAVDEFSWALGMQDYLLAPVRRCWLLPKTRDIKVPERPSWLRPPG